MTRSNPNPRGRPRVIGAKRALRLQFPCRKCGSAPGDVCRNPGGQPLSTEHADRFTQAAAAAHPEATTP